jgi:hypothetical protein
MKEDLVEENLERSSSLHFVLYPTLLAVCGDPQPEFLCRAPERRWLNMPKTSSLILALCYTTKADCG